MNESIDSTKKGRNIIRNINLIPPTDPIDPRNAILDAEIMSEYYIDYNNVRMDKNNIIEEVPHLKKSITLAKDAYYKKGCIV